MANALGERPSGLATEAPARHALLANPLRNEIARRAAARPVCATELAKKTGYSRKSVSNAIAELKKAGVLELVEKRPGRNGGWFYGATRNIIEVDEWAELPDSQQAFLTAKRLGELQRDQVEALEAGTFHSHPHHTLIRDHRLLDVEGFKRQDEIMLRTYNELVANAAESNERCSRTGEVPKVAVIGLTGFPAAPLSE